MCRMPRPSLLIVLNLITLIILYEGYKLLNFSLYNLLYGAITTPFQLNNLSLQYYESPYTAYFIVVRIKML